jgi:uncharacterized repeat protein (TIGR03803 family)
MMKSSPRNRFSRASRWTVTILLLVAAMFVNHARASNTQVVYSFGGGDGAYFDTELVMDKSGNLYGTSVQGGNFNSGNVFQLTPTRMGWMLTVLYNFTGGLDGGQPYKGVTLDSHGDLYGTAVTGGIGGCEGGCGVVYKLSHSHGSWKQSVIYSFTGGSDGSGPGSPVVFDKQGNLFGATPVGGTSGAGTIYELKQEKDGTWKLALVHSFTGGTDGAGGSAGRLLFDHKGNIYGVATSGGAYGSGTAFQLSSVQQGKWKLKTLYAFKGQPDAGFPYGGLVFDSAANLYGTTYYDGKNDIGAIYELSPVGGKWKETVLHSFAGGSDGNESLSTMVSDAAGNLYGTTIAGGASGCDCGTIFKLAARAKGLRKYSVVYRFKGAPDGAYLYAGMVPDSAGRFYGITLQGGSANIGTIFKFIP